MDEILSVEGIDSGNGRQDLARTLTCGDKSSQGGGSQDYIIKKALEYGKYPLITATSPKSMKS